MRKVSNMTEVEFTNLKRKIENKKLEIAQAKGKQESILENWKKNHGVSTLEEAEKKLIELKAEKDKKIKQREEYFEKLRNITNW